ncbi:MAG: hypothetical protein D3910_05005 [Candidatus Electrothrix sp. ATG2]|nr:hypothetical protein [Candidatus Electrothrix sp. ATG2]
MKGPATPRSHPTPFSCCIVLLQRGSNGNIHQPTFLQSIIFFTQNTLSVSQEKSNNRKKGKQRGNKGEKKEE